MGNDIIYCFNKEEDCEDEFKGQCIYAKCPMFSEELDLCKLELLKTNPKQATRKTPEQKKVPVKDEPQRKPEQKEGIGYLPPKSFQKIITGTLKTDPFVGETQTRYGPTQTAKLTIEDETGEANVTLWGDELSEKALKYTSGSKMTLTNMSVQEPYKGTPQLGSTRKTEKSSGTDIS